jgi:hypothetical protein
VNVTNRLLPNQQQIAALGEPGPGGPIHMVNLLKFKDEAEYEDGRETNLSGREAYQLYGVGVVKLLAAVGGSIQFLGDVTYLTLGEVDELWDEVAIASYPSRAAMLEMMMMPEMLEISVHRSAGLVGQLNIETVAPT